jgi:hypothetical protein
VTAALALAPLRTGAWSPAVDRAVAGLTDRQRSYIARARVVREARAKRLA